MDKYACFRDLQDHEVEGIDYKVRSRIGGTGVALLCIHGGDIEPGTSEIADGIAGDAHTFYALEGMKTSGNRALHITSTAFDEPLGIEIACASEIIISVHGCSEVEEVVHIGGLDQALGERIGKKLDESGFKVLIDSNPRRRGVDQRNVCNLCGSGIGVQLEVSRGLRSRMFEDLTSKGRQSRSEVYYRFVFAVQDTLEPSRLLESEPAESDGWEIIQ